MARFLVTKGSNFTPFTYDELTRPLYEMAEAQNSAQEQYDALGMQTAALRNYISDNPDDERVRTMYNDYVDKLNSLQEGLWAHGYNSSTRRNLAVARNGFYSDISRIGKAIESRQKRSEEYHKYKHEHPDAVMGTDPGLGGLDPYLTDDLYGSDWYNYSGDQFAKEVGADAEARSKEFFNSLAKSVDVTKDPRLQGYLLMSISPGATSRQVSSAAELVRNAVRNDNLDARFDESSVEGILANVLMSHLNATGAYGKVDSSEFGRLVERGVEGIGKAIGESKPQAVKDLVYEQNAEYSNWYRKEAQKRAWAKQDAEDAAKKAAEEAAKQEDNARRSFTISTDYDEVNGSNSKRAEKDTAKYNPADSTMVKTVNSEGATKEYRSAVKAAYDVYGEEDRMKAYERFHFDIGRDPNPGKFGTRDEKLITGWFIGNDNQRHDIRVNPNVVVDGNLGAIEVLDANGESVGIERQLTNEYHQYRKAYQKNLDYYMRNEPDVYQLARGLDPDSRHKDYYKYGIPEDVPTDMFRKIVMSQPKNSLDSVVARFNFADSDNDKLRERFSAKLADRIGIEGKDMDSLVKLDRSDVKDMKGKTIGIHKYNKTTAEIEDKAIRNLNDVFSVKDGKITNIKRFTITPDSLVGFNGGHSGFIVTTADNNDYFIGSEMFGGDIEKIFDVARNDWFDALRGQTPKSPQDILFDLFNDLKMELDNVQRKVEGPTGDDDTGYIVEKPKKK